MLSIGTIKYSENPYKIIVEIDQAIADYYRSFIPKYFNVKRPKYSAHISVLRKEDPKFKMFWNKYDGKNVSFEYENYIYNDETYYWLNAWSDELENIRKELGLMPTSDITYSPDHKHKFDITIGNIK